MYEWIVGDESDQVIVKPDSGIKDVKAMLGALGSTEADTLPAWSWGACTNGDATRLPFPDATFDRVIAAEVLEHIPADDIAIADWLRTRAGESW